MNMKSYCLAVVVLSMALPCQAIPLVLDDLNSQVLVDPDSQAGIFSWTVDGTENISQQWSWLRVGAVGPESSLDTLNLNVANTFDPNSDGTDNGLFLQYADSGGDFTVEVFLTLIGGTIDSGVSDLTETIRVINTGATPLDFHFFQYVNLDLHGTPADDMVERINANAVVQSDASLSTSETVMTPASTRHEVALSDATLMSLNDGAATTLGDMSGPIFGDVASAFQWDFTLQPDSSFVVGTETHLVSVPEPSTLWLCAIAIISLVIGRRVWTSHVRIQDTGCRL